MILHECSCNIEFIKRVDLLALLYVVFSCVFVTFPYGVLGQVWYLIVSIQDLCLLPYVEEKIEKCEACQIFDSFFVKSLINAIIKEHKQGRDECKP